MADDDEIVVTIEPELDAALGGEDTTVKIKGADDAPIDDLKAQFATMKGTLDTTTQRATNAETVAQRAIRERDELNERNKSLETELVDTKKGTVDQGIATAKREADQAQSDYERAFSDGDAKAAAEAQRRMSRAEGTISRLEEAKDDLAATKQAAKKPPTEADQVRQQPQNQQFDAEAFIASRSPTAQTWLRANREWVDGGKKSMKLTAAHMDAEAEGLQADTPEYFAHIEKHLGIKSGGKTQLQRRPGAPVAPGGAARGSTAGAPSTVSLTAGEARAAVDGTHTWAYNDPTGKNRWQKGDVLGVQEFARRKLAMQKEGRYDRSFVES